MFLYILKIAKSKAKNKLELQETIKKNFLAKQSQESLPVSKEDKVSEEEPNQISVGEKKRKSSDEVAPGDNLKVMCFLVCLHCLDCFSLPKLKLVLLLQMPRVMLELQEQNRQLMQQLEEARKINVKEVIAKEVAKIPGKNSPSSKDILGLLSSIYYLFILLCLELSSMYIV